MAKAESKAGKGKELKAVQKPVTKEAAPKPSEEYDPYKIIKNPLSTEKSIKFMDSQNKLIFSVAKHADKMQIKDAIEKMFKVKVVKVNTYITPKGEKRAYVKFSPETPAIDIATNLGLM